ncbi:ornithine carbamoyltransferase [Methanocella paludicola SANAE]|uniref:Ornithine carbamoyltransferase n=1 Tax=Methanocella paludicola (strain DSM 17711 / JCM 13418 / NBRC 101707 / SANAE) TaxID=304371 RepID=D1Z099_METPS|nr:ornithine carbamoyltransferase [Methanocella paludicola]BAI62121.1 ornithine carbamoyltransferase [Methanocella paludicola SANAE]
MHIISIADLSVDDINGILDLAEDLKKKRKDGVVTDYLKNKSLVMIFEKSSTRTRVSFEVGMTDLGGHALYLDPGTTQIGRGETIADTAKILSRYAHCIMIRAKSHYMITEMAKNATIPVINGLDDHEHPCQVLADLMTIRERKGPLKGLKLAWIGDGNNVCNSLILASAMTGMKMVAACPKGYEPDKGVIEKARSMGGDIKVLRNPKEAAKDADVLYTDVWVSMGDESEMERRYKDLRDYQINIGLVKLASKGCIVLHCLPAHRGQEITDEVINSENSAVFDEAENRLHAQKALLIKLIGNNARA